MRRAQWFLISLPIASWRRWAVVGVVVIDGRAEARALSCLVVVGVEGVGGSVLNAIGRAQWVMTGEVVWYIGSGRTDG